MINTRIEIDGEEKDALLFDDLFEYVTYFGSDISHYSIMASDERNFVYDEEDFIEDADFFLGDSIEYEGETYRNVNWGEEEESYINEKRLYQPLYSIYQRTKEAYFHQHKFQNYKSLIFKTEGEAHDKVEELNTEEE